MSAIFVVAMPDAKDILIATLNAALIRLVLEVEEKDNPADGGISSTCDAMKEARAAMAIAEERSLALHAQRSAA